MKVDRVIIALNNNQTYTHFWNVFSPIWVDVFKIKPVLIFNGTIDEFNQLNFNMVNCEYIIVNKIKNIPSETPDWSVTWSLFWGASQFKDDVCMLVGADQLPLSLFFFDKIKDFSKNDFVIGFSDAYKNYNKETLGYFNTKSNVMYPSSHLVGKGSIFKEIFEIDDLWEDELKKVYSKRELFYLNCKFYPNTLWGLDECYSSDKIFNFPNKEKIHHLNIFWDYWHKNRIDLGGNINNNFSIDNLKNGHYSELTTKNFFGDKLKINTIIDVLKKCII